MPTSVISGTVVDPSGTPVVGAAVNARIVPKGATRISDAAVLSAVETATTDGSGNWSLTLEEQSNVAPTGSYFAVEEVIVVNGNTTKNLYAIVVPVSNSNVEACKVQHVSPGSPIFATPSAALALHEIDTTSVHGIPDTTVLATDAEVASAVITHEAAVNPHPNYATDTDLSTHAAAADPHPGYLTPAEGNAAYDPLGAASASTAIHAGLSDPHPGYLTPSEGNSAYEAAGAVATHAAAGDPHGGYQKESEKAQANGYASLDSGTLVPVAQVATGTPDGTKFLRDDRSWQALPASGIQSTIVDQAGDLIVATAADTVARLPKGAALEVLRVKSDGTTLEYAAPTGGTTIAQQDAEPSSPVEDDLWIDTDESAGVGLSSILAYAEILVDQTGITTTEVDVTGLNVTVTVPAGRRLRVSAFGRATSTAAVDRIQIFINADGSNVVIAGDHQIYGGAERVTWSGSIILSPTAGAHTYKIRAKLASGTGPVSIITGAQPVYILVEDITGTLWPAGQSIGAGTIASEAWTDYTPTLTNMTLGNGSIIARYQKIGRTVHVKFRFTLGSTSAMGTGPYFSLPVPINGTAYPSNSYLGRSFMTDVTTNIHQGFVQLRSGGEALLRVETAGGTYVNFADITATVPFTWASTHYIDTSFTYEAAA